MGLKGQNEVQGSRGANRHGAGDGGFKTGSVDILKTFIVLAKYDGPRLHKFELQKEHYVFQKNQYILVSLLFIYASITKA